MNLIKAPNKLDFKGLSVFLCGSIEMGSAINWQTYVIEKLKDLDITVLNPRRDDWDSSWVQSIDNPQFREQVEWELEAQEKADVIVIYFDKDTKSPITLLELGLFVRSGKLIVCCPEGFWRKGNVDIVCKKYNVTQVDSLDKLVEGLRRLFDRIM
jgi:hypothetical protein